MQLHSNDYSAPNIFICGKVALSEGDSNPQKATGISSGRDRYEAIEDLQGISGIKAV